MLLLALLLAGSPGSGADALHAELAFRCSGCFSMEVELDGARLVAVGALGAARLQGSKLGLEGSPRFEGLAPGTHHLRVVRHSSPFARRIVFDGPISLRPGVTTTFDVEPDKLVERAPPAAAGAVPPLAPAPASLTIRADDGAFCAVVLDERVRLELQVDRVVRAAALEPGLHRLEVRTLQGKTLTAGTLFVGAGEQATGGVQCHTGAFQSFADPLAYHADHAP